MFSLPVLLRPITAGTGWSTTGVSAAMTVGFLAMAVGSAAWGALSDRIGARWTCLAGSLLLGAGLLLASVATSLTGFQIAFGLLVGLATSAMFAPIMASWCAARRRSSDGHGHRRHGDGGELGHGHRSGARRMAL
jgi:MFS family permease